ncbi:hypothetical protein QWY75_02685 [Pontixanthobacter aestiaquae]|uniref:Uncharacterized protein n=1 Tax=Pontixanthobacter aestiaquae TaxID=1509367 RepID=A0A844ZDN1_9SPHN|nr:hypothetical protein [Pontixanthobacter aestiaquae]MDN3645111.1 hypothetical protein [Pontixanthobacter aestiaquae]MXO83889.1 hypothetical protein [Pontixanthobacter aestiaquae]
MSDKSNPAEPRSNDEKFKPQNVQDESHGSVTSGGRNERNMDDVSRGSESKTSIKKPR